MAVAEEKSFTRAARRLHLAQSGLSMSVRALERELGVPLLIRTPRQVTLTQAGETLLLKGRDVLRRAAEARAAVEAIRSTAYDFVRLGVYPLASSFGLAAALDRFAAVHPSVRLEVYQAYSNELLDQVRHGALDLAVAAVTTAQATDLSIRRLAVSEVAVFCRPDHALAQREGLGLSELRGARQVRFYMNQPSEATPIDRLLRKSGVELPAAVEVNTVRLQLDLAARGLGIALAPLPATAGRADLRRVPLRPAVEVETVVATSADRPLAPAARALADLIVQAAAPGESAA